MVDKREAQLTLGIKTEGASKAAADIDKIAKEYADIAKTSGSVGSSLRLATAEAEKFGATDDDIRDLNQRFNEYRKTIDATTADVEELAVAQQDVTDSSAGGDGGGKGIGSRIASFGTNLRALPSARIPGVPISSDQVATLFRLGGAISEVAEKSTLVTTATTALTPALGAQSAATFALGGAVAAILIPLALAAAAISSFAQAAGKTADSIGVEIDKQREFNKKVAEGLTSKDADDRLKEIADLRKGEQKILDETTQGYAEFESNARQAVKQASSLDVQILRLALGEEGAVAALKVLRPEEDKLIEKRDEATKNIASLNTEEEDLKTARADGTLAANDAKASEEELAKARSAAALDAADDAGKELAAQQKALGATEEQNQKRLASIDDESAVLQKQIDVLTDSGDTSEAVTKKIADLTGQLGLLGKESKFITDTALEASRQADAEKKAKKDAEDDAKKATQAQEQYTKSVVAAGKTFANSTQDIATRFRNTVTDNQTKFDRDLTDIATKYRQGEVDLTIKANRSERDAALNQVDDLKKIRADGSKEEQDAIREGDFKALFLARQKTADTLNQEQMTVDKSAEKRRLDAQDAREDLLRNAQRTRSDRMLGFERQATDARTAQQRELAQANLTRQRALQAASEANNASLAQLQTYLNTKLKMEQSAYNASLSIGQNANALKTQSPFGAPTSFTAGGIGRIIKR